MLIFFIPSFCPGLSESEGFDDEEELEEGRRLENGELVEVE